MAPRLCPLRAVLFGRSRFIALGLALAAIASASNNSLADEGGLSFWLTGQFGSLAAAPQVPGWTIGFVNYYTNVSAGGSVAAARQITIGKFSPTVSVNLNANLNANSEAVFFSPTYVFATPVLTISANVAGLREANDDSIGA
jgi:hypothetical protein